MKEWSLGWTATQQGAHMENEVSGTSDVSSQPRAWLVQLPVIGLQKCKAKGFFLSNSSAILDEFFNL